MQTILTVVHLFLSLGLIGLVLIQHGKGADMGAAFGSGASATVFGARGSGSFLSRTTALLAALFFVTSMILAYYASQVGVPAGLMDKVDQASVAPLVKPAEVPGVPPVQVPQALGSAAQDASLVPPPSSSASVPAVPLAPEASGVMASPQSQVIPAVPGAAPLTATVPSMAVEEVEKAVPAPDAPPTIKE